MIVKEKTVYTAFLVVICSVLAMFFWIQSHMNYNSVDNNPWPSTPFEPSDVVRFYQWNNPRACKNIKYFGGTWDAVISRLDGYKAVCMDEQVRPQANDCLVYSFGVREEWSFDQAMADFNCEVHSFDPDAEKPNQIAGAKKFNFYNIGLDGRKDWVNGQNWTMKTLGSVIEMLGHTDRIIDYLKIDIEGGEFDVLYWIINSGISRQIKQIAIETHNFGLREKDREKYISNFQVLWNFEKHGFRRFSSHPTLDTDLQNEMAGINDYCCYEIAWYNTRFTD